jgi:hypothetical protein
MLGQEEMVGFYVSSLVSSVREVQAVLSVDRVSLKWFK